MEKLTDGELLQIRAALKDRQDMGSLPANMECVQASSHAISKVQEELRERGVHYGY